MGGNRLSCRSEVKLASIPTPSVRNDEAERASTIKSEDVIHSIGKALYAWKQLPSLPPASPWVCDDRVTSDLSDSTISSSPSFPSELAAYNCHNTRTSKKSETLGICFVHLAPSPSPSPSEHLKGRLIRANAFDTGDFPDFFRSRSGSLCRSHTSSPHTVDSDMKTLLFNNKSTKNRSFEISPSMKQRGEESDHKNPRKEYQTYSCPTSLFQNVSESEQEQLQWALQATKQKRKIKHFRSLAKSSSLISQLSPRNNSRINHMNFLCVQDDDDDEDNDIYTSRECIFSNTLTTFTNLFICGG